MAAVVKLTAWADRLPLDDIRGLRLLAAAIYHGVKIAPDAESLWRDVLHSLQASKEEITAGETATLQDFIFDPADLWQNKHLAMFIVNGWDSCWPDLGRELPICRNDELWHRADLMQLFDQYRSWHLAPLHAKPLFNVEFGHQIEHFHWRNYLAPYCEEPQGRGHPKGPRWHDGRASAASHAWSLLYNADKGGQELSVSEAVRRSVGCLTFLKPTDPEPERREAERYIRASSDSQAQKIVRKELEKILAREPIGQ